MDIRAAPNRPAAAPRVMELVAQVPMFRGLAREDIARVAAGATLVHGDRGQVLFQRGDPCAGFHYVAYGQVKLTVGTAAGAEKVMEILGPGRTFGEAVMFTSHAYPVGATVLCDSLLVHVRSQALFDEVERDPQLARRILGSLAVRLHMMVRDVEVMTLHSASQRVIGYLARLEDEGGGGTVTLPAQKSLVASRLNLTPEYFSRILHDLAAERLIRVEGRDIEILDTAALRAYGSRAG